MLLIDSLQIKSWQFHFLGCFNSCTLFYDTPSCQPILPPCSCWMSVMLISCSIFRKSNSPFGELFSSDSFSWYLDFVLFGDFSDFLNLAGNLKDANDMLLPFEKIALLAFNFLSNSFWSRTLLSGGVGPDLEGVLLGKGGVGTLFMNIGSDNSELGDSSWVEPRVDFVRSSCRIFLSKYESEAWRCRNPFIRFLVFEFKELFRISILLSWSSGASGGLVSPLSANLLTAPDLEDLK